MWFQRKISQSLFSVILLLFIERYKAEDIEDGLDLLQPYVDYHSARVKRSNAEIQKCQEIKYGNVTHSKIKAYSGKNISNPIVEAKYVTKEIGKFYYKNPVTVRYQRVVYPVETLSVLEPLQPGTCQPGFSNRTTTTETASRAKCMVAVNGGFFNTTTGACLGNIVSNGYLVQDSGGKQNAHFGITKDDYIYVGYLSELDLITENFKQLIGGVLWIIRDGEIYIDKSKEMECPDTEETGTIDRFINVQAARSAVGHDKEGRVILVQLDGKTGVRGATLYEFAGILLEMGVVNAVNLDGGGSVTTVINNTLVNYPSDQCVNSTFSCEREITTILCVHEPYCDPRDCNQHGDCVLGKCVCSQFWAGKDCNTLSCGKECKKHGSCSPVGCVCNAGWHGVNCTLPCEDGYYGVNCTKQCFCVNGGKCDRVSGLCQCQSGFTGKHCESDCPFGYYGDNCAEVCLCDGGCYCHPVTGSCNISTFPAPFQQASSCLLAADIKSNHLVYVGSNQYTMCVSSVITMSVVAALSIILNISLICLYYISRKRHKLETKKAVKKTIKQILDGSSSEQDIDSEENTDADEETSLFSKTKPGKR